MRENCRKTLSKVISVLYEINGKLMDGSIKILDLRHILKSSDSFQKTVSMLRDQDTDSIISALTVRQEELEEFEKTKQVIQKFVGNCLHFKGKYYNDKQKYRLVSPPPLIKATPVITVHSYMSPPPLFFHQRPPLLSGQ